MMREAISLGLMLGALTAVWAGSFTPRIGAVREPDGSIRPLFGLSSNLIVGEPLPLDPALAAAFSDRAGLVLVTGQLELTSLDGRVIGSYPSSETSAILDISNGPDTAIAWLPATGTFVRWNGSRFVGSTLDVSRLAGRVRAIRLLDSSHVGLLVVNGETLEDVCVSIADGAPVRSEALPGGSESAFQAGSFLLFHDASGLELREPDGRLHTLSIPQRDLAFEKSGKDWLHIRSESAGRQWMLHLDAHHPTLSELPAASTIKPRSAK